MSTNLRARFPHLLAAAAVSLVLTACATSSGSTREWRYDTATGEWGFHPIAATPAGASQPPATGQLLVTAPPRVVAGAGAQPTAGPTDDAQPTASADPSSAPTSQPTASADPSSAPTSQPTAAPSAAPVVVPTAGTGSAGGAPAGAVSALVPAGPASARVTIVDDAFQPSRVTVRVGGNVSWSNSGGDGHTVTFNSGSSSQILAPGAGFSRTFTAAGTFPYLCVIHSGMTGTVVASDATKPTPGGGTGGTTTPPETGTTPGGTTAPAGGPTASPDATSGPGATAQPSASPDDDEDDRGGNSGHGGGDDDDRDDDDRDDGDDRDEHSGLGDSDD